MIEWIFPLYHFAEYAAYGILTKMKRPRQAHRNYEFDKEILEWYK
ncbi:hypothetical protein [Nitrosopumilus cobalaminigenes]|nr:hypothetical protein [Nitrosopumilus cobalaminigenes]